MNSICQLQISDIREYSNRIEESIDSCILSESETRERGDGGSKRQSMPIVLIKQQSVMKKRENAGIVLNFKKSSLSPKKRYFKDFNKTSFTGVDIDKDNIQRCRKNLPFGSYFEIPKYPPTTLPDSPFDLIIGISVFTHLKEENQFLWLKELHRIACKGAILLMTVHGQDAVIRRNLPPDLLLPLNIRGFLDTGHNLDLGEAIDSNGYYRNVYHSTGYIRRKWSKYFEVIDIIPGCIGNLQDMIVLRKN